MDKAILSILLLVIATVIVLGCFIYHVGFHPEWTGAQSLRKLWVFYLLAVGLGFLGVRLTKSHERGGK